MVCELEAKYKGIRECKAGTFTNHDGKTFNYPDSYKLLFDQIINGLPKQCEIKITKETALNLAKNLNIYDNVYIVTDEEAIQTAKDLARLEGIMCGISSGTNVAAAKKLAKKLGKGKTVVTVLPDTAERYFSTPLFEQ